MFKIFFFDYNENNKKSNFNILKKFLYYLIYLPYLPLFIAILLITPFVYIRIGFINAERIGHLVSEVNTYLLMKKSRKNDYLKKKHTLDLFFRSPKVSNKFVYKKLVESNLFVLSRFIIFPIYKWMLLFKMQKRMALNHDMHRDLDDLTFKSKPSIILNDNEKLVGLSFLDKINFPRESKLVLLFSRDSAYINSILNNNQYKDDFRDVDINTFKKTVDYLIKNNYYVLRMGSLVKEKLEINSNRYFDYASSALKSELLDVFLSSHCSFAVSVSTGIDELPKIYSKPICFVNFVPFSFLRSNCNSLTIFKKPIDSNTKEMLSYPIIYDKGLDDCLNGDLYRSKNISFINNSEDEILYCIKEFIENFLSDKVNFKQSKLQKNFTKNYLSKRYLHGKNKRGFISEEFINKNKKLFI